MSEPLRSSLDIASENANVECDQGEQREQGRLQSWKIEVLLVLHGHPITELRVSIVR